MIVEQIDLKTARRLFNEAIALTTEEIIHVDQESEIRQIAKRIFKHHGMGGIQRVCADIIRIVAQDQRDLLRYLCEPEAGTMPDLVARIRRTIGED
jgi:hypothetical protein